MAYRAITTRDEFERSVTFGVTTESKHLEFKGGYGWNGAAKEAQAVELCRDIAQFANTEGGVLLVGVSEATNTAGTRVAGGISPVDDPDGFKNWLEQAIRNYLTPSTFTRHLSVIDTASGAVLAVNIEPSLHLVALWHKRPKSGIEYLYRTEHGKQWMNPEEVEKHLMNASRAARLAVLDVKQRATSPAPVELVPPISAIAFNGDGMLLTVAKGIRPALGNCGERSVGLVVYSGTSNKCLEIPYGMIRDAWVTTDGRPGLYLTVRLVQRANDIVIEPLEQGFPALD